MSQPIESIRLRKVCYRYYDQGPPYPIIQLGGRYLEAFGFQIGDVVEVVLDHGQIMISKKAGVDEAHKNQEELFKSNH